MMALLRSFALSPFGLPPGQSWLIASAIPRVFAPKRDLKSGPPRTDSLMELLLVTHRTVVTSEVQSSIKSMVRSTKPAFPG